MVVTSRMTGRCTGWERPKALMLDFVFFQGEAPLKFQTNCVSPPDFFLLRSRTIFYLKKPPLKNEAIKNAPRKTKLQNKCPPEIWTARPHGGSAQKQPYLTSQFRGALLTQSVTLEFSQDTGWGGNRGLQRGYIKESPPGAWLYQGYRGAEVHRENLQVGKIDFA